MLKFLVCLYIYRCIFIIELVLNLLEICKARVCNARFESHSGYDCDYSLLICYTVSSGKKIPVDTVPHPRTFDVLALRARSKCPEH